MFHIFIACASGAGEMIYRKIKMSVEQAAGYNASCTSSSAFFARREPRRIYYSYKLKRACFQRDLCGGCARLLAGGSAPTR